MLYADSKETVRKLAFSRKFVKENITKSQASGGKRNPKLLENASIINMCRIDRVLPANTLFLGLGEWRTNVPSAKYPFGSRKGLTLYMGKDFRMGCPGRHLYCRSNYIQNQSYIGCEKRICGIR